MPKGFRGSPTSRGGMVRGFGGGGGYGSRKRSGGGGRLYSGGYRPSYRSYSPPAPPSYTPEAMDAVQEAIRKRQAQDAARLAQQPYGGHPLQQQRPDLQYQTVETRWSERAQYAQDHSADSYRQQHQLAENLGGQISGAIQQTLNNQHRGR